MPNSASRRRPRLQAAIGSARWFRRYRAPVIVGWLVVLAIIAWQLSAGPRHEPAAANALPRDAQPERAAPMSRLSDTPPAVKLPADDAAHANATEWWYYSGHLQTDSGERYSFHIATFLRQGTLEHTAFHGSLRDHQTGRPYTAQARTQGLPDAGRRDGFAFSYGPWRITGSGAKHEIKMAGKGYALDLALDDDQPPVLHRASTAAVAGLLDLGAAGSSYYTSRPRMKAEGRLMVEGVSKAVRGTVWFDHQWGDFAVEKLRWNWFALQLADGADLMIYELFDRQGAPLLRMGTYVKDGAASALGAGDFLARHHGSWKSKLSRVVYPMDWTIAVPSRGIDLKLEAVVRTSQFDARPTTLDVYWEGAVKVGGSHAGAGFLELSGYPQEAVAVRTPSRR